MNFDVTYVDLCFSKIRWGIAFISFLYLDRLLLTHTRIVPSSEPVIHLPRTEFHWTLNKWIERVVSGEFNQHPSTRIFSEFSRDNIWKVRCFTCCQRSVREDFLGHMMKANVSSPGLPRPRVLVKRLTMSCRLLDLKTVWCTLVCPTKHKQTRSW